ncbi:hypothetical protein RHO15_01455 [Utexia brackfieldae]|uniref:hypothetical protein n=1 Tax=Utexia brackfieldae TaxID=3074108 RepID=UPI00370D5E87
MKIYFAEWNAEYEKLMFKLLQLEKKYDITVLDKVMKHFRRYNLKLKQNKISNKWFIRIHQFFKLRKINPDDILICNGFSICGFIDLIKDLNCRKILVIRDTIDVLEDSMKNKKHWLNKNRSYVDEIIPYFDTVFSFDSEDCKKYNFNYLEQFLPFTDSGTHEIREKSEQKNSSSLTCFFVGEYWTDREKIINHLAPILHNNGCQTDFYLVHYDDQQNAYSSEHKHYQQTPLSYQENIKKSMAADIILEINHQGQSGVSLRTIEAIVLNKKLITTNKAIKNYQFYNPHQIFILENNYDEIAAFLTAKFAAIPIEKLNKYTADGMLETIINK